MCSKNVGGERPSPVMPSASAIVVHITEASVTGASGTK